MKILVIGGTRFFGYHLARRLVEENHRVVLFNRGLTPDDFGASVERIRGDRADHKAFVRRLEEEKFDVVVDMIAYKAADSQAAVGAFAGRVGHFIHISTGSVYIVTRDYPCPLREEDFDRELFPQPKKNDEWWLYGTHKRKCEEVLCQAHEDKKFPVTIFRLPIVMGERDYTLRAYSYFLRLQDGKPLILPDGGLNVFTHIYQGDIVKTITPNLLNRSSFGQTYNLAQEEVLSLRAFILASARILNRKPDLVDIPSDVLKQASLGTSFSPFSMRRPFILSVGKAKKDLDFSSTPFEIWLARTIAWFKGDYQGGPPDNYRTREREIEVAFRYREVVKRMMED